MKIYKDKQIICENAFLAKSFISKLKGLLGQSGFGETDGLLLYPCRQIHSVGMRFNFDAVYLDSDYRIVAVYENIEKNKILPYNITVRYVLELPQGAISSKNLGIGDVLKVCK